MLRATPIRSCLLICFTKVSLGAVFVNMALLQEEGGNLSPFNLISQIAEVSCESNGRIVRQKISDVIHSSIG